jgi:hypothetical protein
MSTRSASGLNDVLLCQGKSNQEKEDEQKHIKPASNEMRFSGAVNVRFSGAVNVRFHFACASVRKTPFTRTASKMSRLFSFCDFGRW